MNTVWICLYIAACLVSTVPLIGLAQESERWRSAQGYCTDNTVDKRTITYHVGSKDYRTSNESVVDVLGQRYGLDFHFRPGQMKETYNGVDPQIGKSVEVFYNPHDPWQAVVMKGWSMPAVIFVFVTLLPMLIRSLAFFGMGWKASRSGGYDVITDSFE